ncbi:molybdate ABC transporter substrate-binding protein [Allosalinactinospora lopnorensis]|uniref:molybdate ABC transporter substrate-binding protein n=1 Tax=Allosalinactinospora lopnorensis TaxID=1352348 RepID=UPI000623C866|nr:molybdate ABC transporter substrate-binding protein [Allosalinactinospora lopnorensis]
MGAAAASALLLGAAGCGPAEDSGAQILTVFAAASLTEPFNEFKTAFEDERPGVEVEFNFAGSSELAQQINAGAPADVFASANPANMDLAAEAGNIEGEPVVFAENTLEIAVPPDNPAGIEDLDDLASEDATVALCAPEVPCGQAARTVMRSSGTEIAADTLEEDVKAALTKVELGEVDAALVYRSDVIASEEVSGIGFPETEDAVNEYPIAVLAGAPQAGPAEEWIDLVTSEAGQGVLTGAGFRAP